MPLIASGASGAVSVPKGYLLALMAGGYGTAAFGPGPAARQAPAPLVGQAQALGPFPDVQTVYLTSASGQLVYSLQRADGMVPSLVPASPFKLSPLILEQSAVALPLTGTTVETTLASILVPGGLMGLNGVLRLTTLWSTTNSANTKALIARLNGVAWMNATVTAVNAVQMMNMLRNRNNRASQVFFPAASVNSFTNTATANGTSAVDTSVDQVLTLSAQLGLGSETITLESYIVEVLPG